MKKIMLLCAFGFSTYFATAQAVETTSEYNKANQPAVSAEFSVDSKLADNVIGDDLKSRGFGKGKSSKGYTLYQGINFNEISSDKIDLYIKADKKGKKDKDKTVVTALVSKGYDNFISSTTDSKAINGLITYINGLKPKFEMGNLDDQIKQQEEVVKKEEKKQNNYIDDVSDLEKKKKNIEDDIIKKKADVDKQKAEVDKQRQFLEALKAQRKN